MAPTTPVEEVVLDPSEPKATRVSVCTRPARPPAVATNVALEPPDAPPVELAIDTLAAALTAKNPAPATVRVSEVIPPVEFVVTVAVAFPPACGEATVTTSVLLYPDPPAETPTEMIGPVKALRYTHPA